MTIIAFSGTHGCFGKGTPIRMYDGTVKAVEQVEVGDVVLGDDYTPRTVLRLVRGEEPLYLFTYMDKSSHIYNKSHELYLRGTHTINDIKVDDDRLLTVEEYLNLDMTEAMCLAKVVAFKNANKVIYKTVDIKGVTAIGVGNYYGFTLDGNNLFLHEDGTVLKNCGKTTLAYKLCAQLKLRGYNSIVMDELARLCPFKINKSSTYKTEAWLVTSQIKTELELLDKFDYIISDRTAMDAVSYARCLGHGGIIDAFIPMVVAHIKRTNHKIFVPDPQSFNHQIDDGVRDLDIKFRQTVFADLCSLYDKHGVAYTLLKSEEEIDI